MELEQKLLLNNNKDFLITFSPDGKKMAIIFSNNTVKIYKRHEAPLNVTTKEKIGKLKNIGFSFE